MSRAGKAAVKIIQAASKMNATGKVAGGSLKKGVSVVAKTIAKHPAASTRIAGAVTAVSGVKDIVKGKDIKTKLKGVVKTAVGVPLLIWNHDEWYTNVNIDGLIGENFARRKGMIEPGIGSENDSYSVPSVCRLAVNLTIPNTKTNGYKQAIQVMYNRIRSANAGAINYGPADLDHYLQAVDSLRSAFYVARRAYSTLYTFDAYDSTLPAALYAGMGLDYDSFRNNAANLKQFGNLMNAMLTNLAPLNIDLFRRHEWMFSNIFADSDDAKSSLYIMSLQEIFSYNYNGNSVTITEHDIASPSDGDPFLGTNTTGMSYSTFIANITAALNKFQSNAVFAIIAGDILKAFGNEAIFPQYDWELNFTTPVIHDEAALSQIQNAITFGTGTSVHTENTIDTDGLTKTEIRIERIPMSGAANPNAWDLPLLKNPFINSNVDNVSPAKLISLTRFSMAISPSVEAWGSDEDGALSTSKSGLINGTEIITSPFIFYTTRDSVNYGKLAYARIGLGIGDVGETSENNFLAWATFDYAPQTNLIVATGNTPNDKARSLGFLFDFNNYARSTDDQISTYHDYAVMSLLHIPAKVKLSSTIDLNMQ